MIYPNDANGDALRRMEAQGDDLSRPRNIDFTVAFADASSAEQFAEHFRALGHRVSVELTETDQDFPWDAVVVNTWCPPTIGSLVLRTYYNPSQTIGEGTTMAGVVSPNRVQCSERTVLSPLPPAPSIRLHLGFGRGFTITGGGAGCREEYIPGAGPEQRA